MITRKKGRVKGKEPELFVLTTTSSLQELWILLNCTTIHPRKASHNKVVILSRMWVCWKIGKAPEFHYPKAKSLGESHAAQANTASGVEQLVGDLSKRFSRNP